MPVKLLSRVEEKMGIQKVSLDSVHLKKLGSELANIGSDFNQLLKSRKSVDARALQNSKANLNGTKRAPTEEKVQYKCKICAYQTDSSQTFKIHVKKKHGLNIVSNIQKEDEQKKAEAQRKSIPCKFCKYQTSNKEHLVEHIKSKHKDILEKHRRAKPKQNGTPVAIRKLPEKSIPEIGLRRSSREKAIDANENKMLARTPARREKLKELQYSGDVPNNNREKSTPKKELQRKAKNTSDTSDFESPVKSSNGSHVLEDILAEFHRIETDNSIFNSENLEFSKNLDLTLQEDIESLSKKSQPSPKKSPKSKPSRRISSTQSRRRESSEVEITEVRDKGDKGKDSADGKDKSAEIVDLSDSEDEGKGKEDDKEEEKQKDDVEPEKEKTNADSEHEESSKEDDEEKDEDSDEEDDEEARLEYLKAKESYRKLKLAKDLAEEVSEDLTDKPESESDTSKECSDQSKEGSAAKEEPDSSKKDINDSKGSDSRKDSDNVPENESKKAVNEIIEEKEKIVPVEDKPKLPEPKSAADIQNDLISSLTKDEDSSEDEDDLDVDDLEALREQMGGGLEIKASSAPEEKSEDKKDGTTEDQKKPDGEQHQVSESGISVIDVENKKTELLTDEKINNIVSETDDTHHVQCTGKHAGSTEIHTDHKLGLTIDDLTGNNVSGLDTAWEEMLDSMWDKPPTGNEFDISESVPNQDLILSTSKPNTVVDINNNVSSSKLGISDEIMNDFGIDLPTDSKISNDSVNTSTNDVDATWEDMVVNDHIENNPDHSNSTDKLAKESKAVKSSKKRGNKGVTDDTSDFDSDVDSRLKNKGVKSKSNIQKEDDSDDNDNIDAAWESMIKDLEDRAAENECDTEPARKSNNNNNNQPLYRKKDKAPAKPAKKESPYLSTKDLVGEKLNSIFNSDERNEDGVDTTGERMLEKMLLDMNRKERTDTVTERILENSRKFDMISQVHVNPVEKPKKRAYNRKEDTVSKNKRLKQDQITNYVSKDTNVDSPKSIVDKSNEKDNQEIKDNKDLSPNEDVYKQLQSSITDDPAENNTPETTEDLNNELLALMMEGPSKDDQRSAEDLNEEFLSKMPEGSNNDADSLPAEDIIEDGKCPKCDFVSKCRIKAQAKQNIKLHIKAVHDKIKDIKCERCDYKTAQRSNLTIHMRVHRKDGSQTAEDYFKEKAEDAAKDSSSETSKTSSDKPTERVPEKIDFRRQRGRPYASASNSMIKLSEINNTPKDIEKRMKQQLEEKKGPTGSTVSTPLSSNSDKATIPPNPATTADTSAVKKEEEKKKEEEEDVLEKEYTVTIGNEEVKIQEWKNKIKIQTKNEVLRKQFEAELQKARQKNKGK